MGLRFRTVETAQGYVGFVASRRGLRRVYLPHRNLESLRRAIRSEAADAVEDPSLMPGLARDLRRYFAGDTVEFAVPLDWTGFTPFEVDVWHACRRIREQEYTDPHRAGRRRCLLGCRERRFGPSQRHGSQARGGCRAHHPLAAVSRARRRSAASRLSRYVHRPVRSMGSIPRVAGRRQPAELDLGVFLPRIHSERAARRRHS